MKKKTVQNLITLQLTNVVVWLTMGDFDNTFSHPCYFVSTRNGKLIQSEHPAYKNIIQRTIFSLVLFSSSWNITFDPGSANRKTMYAQRCAWVLKVFGRFLRKEKQGDAFPLRALRHTDNCCIIYTFPIFLISSFFVVGKIFHSLTFP